MSYVCIRILREDRFDFLRRGSDERRFPEEVGLEIHKARESGSVGRQPLAVEVGQ